MYYVYLLKSDKDGRYYIGYSEDVGKRLSEHNAGYVNATKNRQPLKLVGYETYKSEAEARWREHEVKKSAHKRYTFIKRCRE
jgi:putative endonuclease